MGWKGACWAEIGSSLRPEQRNYPPPTPSPWQEPGTQTQTVCADLSAPEARQQPASSRLSDDGQSLHAHAGKVSGPTERAALESHSARPFTAGPARGPLLTPTLLHPLVQAHTHTSAHVIHQRRVCTHTHTHASRHTCRHVCTGAHTDTHTCSGPSRALWMAGSPGPGPAEGITQPPE